METIAADEGLIGGVHPRSGVSARIGFHPHANSPVDLSCDSVDDFPERCETIAEDKNGSNNGGVVTANRLIGQPNMTDPVFLIAVQGSAFR